MRRFRNIVIIKTTTTFKQKAEILENIKNITKNGIIKTETSEIKDLAYSINRNKKGVFIDSVLKTEWEDVEKINIYLKDNKNVLKFITYLEE